MIEQLILSLLRLGCGLAFTPAPGGLILEFTLDGVAHKTTIQGELTEKTLEAALGVVLLTAEMSAAV